MQRGGGRARATSYNQWTQPTATQVIFFHLRTQSFLEIFCQISCPNHGFAYGISKNTSLVNFTKWKNFCFHNLFLVNLGQLLLVTFCFCQCSSNHLLSDWLWILKQKALYLFLYLLTYAQTIQKTTENHIFKFDLSGYCDSFKENIILILVGYQIMFYI